MLISTSCKPNLNKLSRRLTTSTLQSLIISIILQGTNLPFTRKVVELALLLKFRIPQIDLYNKTKDPGDHIETYRAYMTQYGALDEIT
jgi:hypothetical protein